MLDNTYFRSIEFEHLSYADQAQVICENLEWLDNLSPEAISFLATSILRAYCGCSFEPIQDELSGEWFVINEHDASCHKKLYPIEEDLSDRTIKRRAKKFLPMSDEMLVRLEEKYANVNS